MSVFQQIKLFICIFLFYLFALLFGMFFDLNCLQIEHILAVLVLSFVVWLGVRQL